MKKLLILLILSLFSTAGLTASCPDGNEPTKTVSDDGSYYVYKCAIDNNDGVSNRNYIKGVNEDQWAIIDKIGDPLNCQQRIEEVKKAKIDVIVSYQEFVDHPSIINKSIRENSVTKLEAGEYIINSPINVGKGKILIGETGTRIIGRNTSTAIHNAGSIANLEVINAKKYGIEVQKNSDTYNVIIKNTGINSPNNSQGVGLQSSGSGSSGNCVVSVEVLNGYNEIGSSDETAKGGNADGFTVKYGAHDITFIDSHSHHNSDDGFDFWKGGAGADIEKNVPTIRIFYSSANHNGKNPLTTNGDGNGFKFGSWDGYQKNRGVDKGDRLVYGSVACFNVSNGFDRNKTSTNIITNNLNAVGNKEGFKDVSSYTTMTDPQALKCSMFPTQ
jgi:hypothetical protein|tara:strand:+ start:129 stop:1289 length:1161 start_codon:yes stop_codon:yes gene_type:complete